MPHPLDPLSRDELASAISALRGAGALTDGRRLVSLVLHEAVKHESDWDPGTIADERLAFAVIFDPSRTETRECVVAIGGQAGVISDRAVPGAQAAFVLSEYEHGIAAMKADLRVRDALALRGLTDLELLHVELWPFGDAPPPELAGRRVAWCALWRRDDATDNAYAHPIRGLEVIVDVTAFEVVRVLDHGVVEIPSSSSGRWLSEEVGALRPPGARLDVVQPDGVGFRLEGWSLEWEAWTLRIGFHQREGLTLHALAFDGRPICYRASIAELVIPYADPDSTTYKKSAFDTGEYGLGHFVNALERGCDCLGEIVYLDVDLATDTGGIVTLPNAICLHEEDHGLLWKHVDFEVGRTEVRRSRRLVISSIVTVDNYEYGYFWYLYRDGTIEFEAKLTGIVLTAAMAAGSESAYGTTLAPGINAMYHQHFFCARLDMHVDGGTNTVSEVHSEELGDAFTQVARVLEREDDDAGLVDPLRARHWKIANHSRRNAAGGPVAYKLAPGQNVRSFTRPESAMGRRVAFCERHFWVTPFDPDERWPAGAYPNLNPATDGLPRWVGKRRPVVDTDVVCWYVFGAHHVPRLEDWPVMPVEHLGFALRPDGFFDRSPAINLPPEPGHRCHS